MTVTDVKSRIAAICRTIEGVAGADRSPRSLANAQLPFVVVLTGESTRQSGRDGEPGASDMLIVRRLYRLALIVKSWGRGVEGEAEELCEPFFERFEETFVRRPSLQLTDNSTPLPGVLDAWLSGDTGVINIELGGVGYAGVMFDLWVETARVISARGV
jgi:hypothetical protein